MGYSARYHAASLAAVFLALAIGILIGAEFGDDVVSGTRENLEESLTGNLEDARDEADELAAELDRSEEFAERVYPVLAGERLTGRRIGVLGLGGLPEDLSSDIETMLDPTGAELVGVAVVREPLDLKGLSDDLAGTRFADIAANPDTVQALGTGLGRQIVLGGALLDRLQSQLFSRASGRFESLDGLILVRAQPEDLDGDERGISNRLEVGLLDGISATRTTPVGVERSDADPSSITSFEARDIASVDSLDLPSGRLAAVFALLGAEGSFGIKETADRLLPDLLAPAGPGTPAPSPPFGATGSTGG